MGFKGNRTLNSIPVTPTSSNPGKATLFALDASYRCGISGVVYVVDTATVSAIKVEKNWFATPEDEIGFVMLPGDFQDRSLVAVAVEIMVETLEKYNIVVKFDSTMSLTDQLVEIPTIPNATIDSIVKDLLQMKY